MNDEKNIEQLLATFYNGETTTEEEKWLTAYFNRNDLNEKWFADRDLFQAIYDPTGIVLPEGVSERLEKTLDDHIRKTRPQKETRPQHVGTKTKKLYISLLSAAAVALLGLGLFFFSEPEDNPDFIADTFTNPQEAAIAAEQALMFVSEKLNQGLSPLDKVKESMHVTNELINKNVRLK